jgi:uncharacterized protein (DUF433 family)
MTMTFVAEPVPLRTDTNGSIRVGKTRVLLEMVIGCYLEVTTPEEIQKRFDVLELADVYATISYYLRHKTEVEAYLSQQEQDVEKILLDYDEKQTGLREKLLAKV